MLSSRDSALRLGSRIISGYNIWMLVAFVSGFAFFGVIDQWFFSSSATAQNSSTVAYNGDDVASIQSKNPILIAYTIEKHLKTGYHGWLNDYDPTEAALQPVVNEWKRECGQICLDALPPGVEYTTGNNLISCNPASDGCSKGLQCAMFIHTVFALTDHPTPAKGQAIDYWDQAPFNSKRDGWQEFYNGKGMPQAGDLAVWHNDPYSTAGHIAIVVDVQLPQGGADGTVWLAQANGLGNVIKDGANLLSATLHKDGKAEIWGWNVAAAGWNGFEFTGFIHNTSVSYENLTTILNSTGSGNGFAGTGSGLGGYTVIGAPTITADQINTILANAHSPAAGTGQSLHDLGAQYHIDPVFALAFFMEESTFGKAGMAATTHSLGNIRCMPQYPCEGGYAYFDSWKQGYEVWYQLISGPAYVGSGLITVAQIIPKYAPSSDNNNEAQYIRTVEIAVDKWRSGDLSYV